MLAPNPTANVVTIKVLVVCAFIVTSLFVFVLVFSFKYGQQLCIGIVQKYKNRNNVNCRSPRDYLKFLFYAKYNIYIYFFVFAHHLAMMSTFFSLVSFVCDQLSQSVCVCACLSVIIICSQP